MKPVLRIRTLPEPCAIAKEILISSTLPDTVGPAGKAVNMSPQVKPPLKHRNGIRVVQVFVRGEAAHSGMWLDCCTIGPLETDRREGGIVDADAPVIQESRTN
jgi:hypothetical protein